MTSIPGGSAAASSALSSGELDQIRIAAYTTPGSESSPPDGWTDIAGGGRGVAYPHDQQPVLPWDIKGGYAETPWMPGSAGPSGSTPVHVVSPQTPITFRSPSASGQDLLYK